MLMLLPVVGPVLALTLAALGVLNVLAPPVPPYVAQVIGTLMVAIAF